MHLIPYFIISLVQTHFSFFEEEEFENLLLKFLLENQFANNMINLKSLKRYDINVDSVFKGRFN